MIQRNVTMGYLFINFRFPLIVFNFWFIRSVSVEKVSNSSSRIEYFTHFSFRISRSGPDLSV